MEFIYFDDQGGALVVDIGGKAETKREVVARRNIFISPQCLEKVTQGIIAKGDVLGITRVADVMGVKKTSELIPLCHILNLTRFIVDFTIKKESNETGAACMTRTTEKTGVEAETLTGVSVALLTVYNICKTMDKSMEIGDIYPERKSGGKSGEFHNPRCARSGR